MIIPQKEIIINIYSEKGKTLLSHVDFFESVQLMYTNFYKHI